MPRSLSPNSRATRPLNYRERQVLRLIAQGMITGEMARALWLSPHTIRFFIKTMHPKLGARLPGARRGARGRDWTTSRWVTTDVESREGAHGNRGWAHELGSITRLVDRFAEGFSLAVVTPPCPRRGSSAYRREGYVSVITTSAASGPAERNSAWSACWQDRACPHGSAPAGTSQRVSRPPRPTRVRRRQGSV